ncbi:NAD(P)-binding protein [Xanthomonas vesicatoria]|nr:NAD/FAD-dependent oxidoreductase [Xanthomonas vesicatoria]MDG4487673.1 NAD(P)-binding protein [Xanthomonas vesicatoria]
MPVPATDPSMSHQPRTVAVIGAGLAGLACAKALQAAGAVVTVYERGDAPGGRMRGRAGAGWQCDAGAQYFTARDPDFAAVVQAWGAAGVAARWPARIARWDGTEMRASQTALTRFVGVPEMAAPVHALAIGLDVRLHAPVRSLQRNGQGWALRVHGEPAMQMVDTVLLALAAPDAAALLAGIAPALATIAGDARMQPAWAVVLRFDARIDPGYDALFVNTGSLRWVARDSSKPARQGAEAWLLHATADWSQLHVDATPEDVSAMLLPELAALGLPLPQACDAYRWEVASTDPPLQTGCVWDAQLRLGMCGDWLAGGRVEGAWQSGTALAQRVSAGDIALQADA